MRLIKHYGKAEKHIRGYNILSTEAIGARASALRACSTRRGCNSPAQSQKVVKMGKIDLIISDELEKKFRDTVFKRYGLKRGNIRKAIEEAINEWIEKGN